MILPVSLLPRPLILYMLAKDMREQNKYFSQKCKVDCSGDSYNRFIFYLHIQRGMSIPKRRSYR